MDKSKARINNPCHLKWDDLDKLENTGKRHCKECSLNIIDFTNMSNQEIIDYLAERKGKRVCGAMLQNEKKSNSNTIQGNVKTWHARIKSSVKDSYFKTFLLFSIGLLMFATGCEKDDNSDLIIIGDVKLPEETGLIIGMPLKPNDSIVIENRKPKKSLQ